jgi:hypothetical protein
MISTLLSMACLLSYLLLDVEPPYNVIIDLVVKIQFVGQISVFGSYFNDEISAVGKVVDPVSERF